MYAEVKKIYDRVNREKWQMFPMVVTYLLDIGFRNAAEITDEEIANAKGNGLMTADFVGALMSLARDLAKAGDPSELVVLCQAEDVFDTVRDAGKLRRTRLEKIVNDFIQYNILSYSELINESYIEPEELVTLGWWTEEDVDKYYEEKE